MEPEINKYTHRQINDIVNRRARDEVGSALYEEMTNYIHACGGGMSSGAGYMSTNQSTEEIWNLIQQQERGEATIAVVAEKTQAALDAYQAADEPKIPLPNSYSRKYISNHYDSESEHTSDFDDEPTSNGDVVGRLRAEMLEHLSKFENRLNGEIEDNILELENNANEKIETLRRETESLRRGLARGRKFELAIVVIAIIFFTIVQWLIK